MLCDKQRKVRVFRLLFRTLIAVAVYRHDAIRIFIYDDAVRVHAEGTHVILKFLGAVYDLALIQLIGEVGKDDSRKLNAHTDVHTV